MCRRSGFLRRFYLFDVFVSSAYVRRLFIGSETLRGARRRRRGKRCELERCGLAAFFMRRYERIKKERRNPTTIKKRAMTQRHWLARSGRKKRHTLPCRRVHNDGRRMHSFVRASVFFLSLLTPRSRSIDFWEAAASASVKNGRSMTTWNGRMRSLINSGRDYFLCVFFACSPSRPPPLSMAIEWIHYPFSISLRVSKSNAYRFLCLRLNLLRIYIFILIANDSRAPAK